MERNVMFCVLRFSRWGKTIFQRRYLRVFRSPSTKKNQVRYVKNYNINKFNEYTTGSLELSNTRVLAHNGFNRKDLVVIVCSISQILFFTFLQHTSSISPKLFEKAPWSTVSISRFTTNTHYIKLSTKSSESRFTISLEMVPWSLVSSDFTLGEEDATKFSLDTFYVFSVSLKLPVCLLDVFILFCLLCKYPIRANIVVSGGGRGDQKKNIKRTNKLEHI